MSPIAKPTKHHYVPVAITLVSLALIVLIGIYTAISLPQKATESGTQLATKQNNKEYSFPRLTVDKWTIQPSAATKSSASQATIYTLNPAYGRSDFNAILSNFFRAANTKETDTSLRAYLASSGNSMFYMDKDTGSLMYKSETGVALASPSAALDESKKIMTFAQSVFRDDTLATFATYERKTNPGVKYYELHRDGNRLGFPIFNLFGLLNTTSIPLKDLSLYTNNTPAMPDSTVIKSSDNRDGFKRPNDFNTVTIGVKNGHIVDVISNLRLFPTVTTRPASDALISYDDAVKKLKKNEYSRLYTSPADSGVVDREKMYPQNAATLTNATVTESTVAYLEELPGSRDQVALAPYYVFRGTATLSSGYKVTFVATVAATNRDVLGVATRATFDSTPKQGTILFEDISGSTGAAQLLAENKQYTSMSSSVSCGTDGPQNVDDLYNTQTDDSTGVVYGQYDVRPGTTLWFAITSTNADINQLARVISLSVVNPGLDRAPDATGVSGLIRMVDTLFSDWEVVDTSCPVFVPGI